MKKLNKIDLENVQGGEDFVCCACHFTESFEANDDKVVKKYILTLSKGTLSSGNYLPVLKGYAMKLDHEDVAEGATIVLKDGNNVLGQLTNTGETIYNGLCRVWE